MKNTNTYQCRDKRIAILLATYNGERFLREQIDSLMGQSFSDFRIYAHDDGSTDGTTAILEEYADKYPDKLQIVNGDPTGSAKNNFFFLFEQVEADYYMCCDQDDVWKEDKIKVTMEAMNELLRQVADEDKARPEANKQSYLPCLIFTDLEVVDQELNTLHDSMNTTQLLNTTRLTSNRLIAQNVVTGCTMMVNKTLRNMLIKNSDRHAIIMHDWWAAIIAAEFGKISYVDKTTIRYRQHGDNSVGAKNVAGIEYKVNEASKPQAMRRSISLGQQQSKSLARVFELDEKNVITQYGNISEKNKLRRIYFYLHHKVLKTGLSRVIAQIIFG